MTKISESYKNDDLEIDDESISKIDKAYLPTIQNLEQSNPKILVVFSGGSGLGKSTLAHKIEAELKGLNLENDHMKDVINELFVLTRRELSAYTWKYSMSLYRRLNNVTQNGLVIRDGIIDWYFDQIIPIFEKQGYQVFTIAFDVSRELNEKLINNRGDKPHITTQRLIELIDEHEIHIKRFREAYKPDVVLTDDNLFDHDMVIAKLSKKIQQLS